jgi:hypothetical protein
MALPRAVLLLVVVVTAAIQATLSAAAESGDKPSVMTPVAHTPVGSFEGADGPVADDATEDEDAAPVGSPIGTTMSEPTPELAPPGAPNTSGANAVPVLGGGVAAAAAIAAAVAAAAGIFAF